MKDELKLYQLMYYRHSRSSMLSEDSYKLFEGAWKEFRFHRILPKDYSNVLEHLAINFTQDEPVEKLLGWSQEMADDLNKVFEFCLKDGMSFLAEHIPSGELAGVRIIFNRTPQFPPLEYFLPKTRSAKLFLKFCEDLETRGNLSSTRGLERWAGFFGASTTRSFRNAGLTGEFYRRSVVFLKAEGFKHAVVITTSPWTAQATKSLDFEEIARINFAELVDYNGEPMFSPDQLEPQRHFAILKLKTL